MEVHPRKVALHTNSHLTPHEAWRKAVSTTPDGRRVSSEVRLENCTQVLGEGQIWRACDSRLRKIVLHTCSDLSKPVQTCSQYRDYVRWLRHVIFLHFRRLSFFSLTSYPGEIAYFSSPNRELSNGTRLVEGYWNRNVDPSRSPCLKILIGKSFDHSNLIF